MMTTTTKLNTMCGSIHSDEDDERINKHDTLRCSSNSRITNTAKNTNNRRTFLSLSLLLAVALPPIEAANAVMTDETDNYADNYWSSSSRWSSRNSLPSPSSSSSSPIDEIVITISKKELQSKGGIGLELADIEFRTNRRVYVKSVLSGSVAESLGIEKNWIIVSVNNQSTERTNVDGVAMMIYTAATTTTSSSTSANNAIDGDDNVAIRFRNPIIFQNQLKNLSSSSSDDATTPANNVVTTQIAPAGDTTQRNAKDGSVKNGRVVTSQTDQRLSVSQLVPPKVCTRGATMDDLLEISYIGRLYDDETQGSSDGGAIFDGSAVKIDGKGIPGRGNDVSLFFVLGKQPFGKYIVETTNCQLRDFSSFFFYYRVVFACSILIL